MTDIIKVINSKDGVIHGKETNENEIKQAELELGLRFADDYRNYIKQFGCMVIGSREITGISSQENYNVVSTTKAQRNYNKNIPENSYVIEQLNIDGIIIWQSSNGEVFQTSPNTAPMKIADSLVEYIQSL
ncbi:MULTISPECIES: SMI1/KNR4 family protein [Ruminococcus]|uniref:Cell wall assembly/cell proliferation coordinating protein, KNR4-like protein n=1 Tax=Ruminococcus bovis TaxID=2564099 RepID=A0A4P8XUF7_9FIRM|nr:SMI1/KNR4 family protein [Ruminococcus bovis]QCT06262.1 cell wall assembly/cell proliferation coordinating protein, KNR4-like protein [Ruminococcus bovis]